MAKKCKNCGIKFETQYSTTQQTCTFHCAIEYSNSVKEKKAKKEWTKEKKKRKDALKTNSDHVRELQIIFNKFIRTRDKEKGCISCSKPLNTKFDAGHYYSTGSYPELRFNEDNVHGQCVHCNQHKRGNLIAYTDSLPNRIGNDRFLKLKSLSNIPRKYTIPELIELKKLYKEKTKEL